MYCSRRARIVRAPLRALFAVACDARHRERRVGPRIRASLHCVSENVGLDARHVRAAALALASAAGCRPNGAPCGAASVRRKKPARVARRMRASSLWAQGCAVSEPPEHAREVGGHGDGRDAGGRAMHGAIAGCPETAPPGACFFGYFLCTSTAPQERREQRRWRQRRAGQDARSRESRPLARRASGSYAPWQATATYSSKARRP
jgi:hypothetical protein